MNRNEDVSVPESALMRGDYEPGSEAPTVIPPGDGGVSPSLPSLPDVELPFTGLSLWPLVWAGFMLLAFGAFLRRGWRIPFRNRGESG
jgi:hypothetical protein